MTLRWLAFLVLLAAVGVGTWLDPPVYAIVERDGLRIHFRAVRLARSQGVRESDAPSAVHPLVRTHPVTGRKSLYLSAHIGTIVGWPVPEARAFLRERLGSVTDQVGVMVMVGARMSGDLVLMELVGSEFEVRSRLSTSHLACERGRRIGDVSRGRGSPTPQPASRVR